MALASSSDPGLRRVIPVEFIEHPSIGPPFIINLINSQDDDINDVDLHPEENVEQAVYGFDKPWLEAIRAYIADGTLPSEKWAAGKVKAQAAQYVLVVGEIYKWRFSRPLMTCVEKDKAQKFMDEIHAGSCRNHSGRRSLAIKIKHHDHYWPTMVQACEKIARKFKKYQRHAPITRQPTEVLSSIKAKVILVSLNRFLLKMGGSRILHKHQGRPCRKLRMEKHSL